MESANVIQDRYLMEETSTPKIVCLALLRGYQLGLSAGIGAHCNFYPTCSRFAYEAVKKTTALQGCFMAADRLFRDHNGLRGFYRYNRQADHFQDRVEDNIILSGLFQWLPF